MARRICSITVIGEGWEDIAFLKGFLAEAGVGDRQCQPRQNPRGEGSGFDFVRVTLAEEIKALAKFTEGRGVLAMMDEDGKTIGTRREWVADLLAQKGASSLDCAAGRCLLFPKRNLETWVYWLTAQADGYGCVVDEDSNYKLQRPDGSRRTLQRDDWRKAGRRLHLIDHKQPPQMMPPELLGSLASLRQFVKSVER